MRQPASLQCRGGRHSVLPCGFFKNPCHAAYAPNRRAAEERTIRAPHRYPDPTSAVLGDYPQLLGANQAKEDTSCGGEVKGGKGALSGS